MKLISWNINGINSCLNKGLLDFIKKENADFYCFQEIKASQEKIDKLLPEIKDYNSYYLFAEKKGYSGVSIHSKEKPLTVNYGIGNSAIDCEGRVLSLEFENFHLVNAYFPHSHRELKRLDFKLDFNLAFEKHCAKLEKIKPVIIASDFNVAHKEIDLVNPKQNEFTASFTIQERTWFDNFLKQGFIDAFREFNSNPGQYTWWSYCFQSRRRNVGWRIDYFVASQKLKNKLIDSKILPCVLGSDHCPISLEVKI